MKSRKIDFSIIIPAYNEEKTIGQIVAAVKKVKYPGTFEIIVINDCSKDSTQEKIDKIAGITKIWNNKNRGKGYCLRSGFSKAKGEIILIQDADLEYDPNDHLKLISEIKNSGTDVIYGSRFLNPNHKPKYLLFYAGNLFLSFLTKILYRAQITDMETCYKCFKSEVLKGIKLREDRFGFEPEITCKLLKKGLKIVEIPIAYKSRSYQEGKKIGIKDGFRAIYILLKYRFAS
ncbi:MAG: glycosyltransferase family 2 protein [Candidatus Curtissbacteria bacterium]|nr:glycosyltransferase family 2 protein [Candidatus Curtissbacteria bacterium]